MIHQRNKTGRKENFSIYDFLKKNHCLRYNQGLIEIQDTLLGTMLFD